MCHSLYKYEIFSNVSDYFKEQIKLFYIFDDKFGINALFATNDDEVFGLGSNRLGGCGLGHTNIVDVPKKIPELCEKNIQQFYNGGSFVLALNSDNHLYSWGHNSSGQLCRGFTSDNFLQPEIIPEITDIVEVSCGSSHTLMIKSDGYVYGWGSNINGQIGCGRQIQNVSKPIKLTMFENSQIRSIHCSYNQSYGITKDGLVYSWGRNEHVSSGHEIENNEVIFEPRIITNLTKITTIFFANFNTYFQADNGVIYFCGLYQFDNSLYQYQKLPQRLQYDIKFTSWEILPIYQKACVVSAAIDRGFVYNIIFNQITKTKYKSIEDFFSIQYQMTTKTFKLNESQSSVGVDFRKLSNRSRLDEKFQILKELGRGGFGKVVKVKDSKQNYYAVKQIILKDFFESIEDDSIKNQILDEVLIWPSNDQFVVKIFDYWSEDNIFYIQMELCSTNLKDIIEEKSKCFERKQSDAMNSIEYFISSQIFKELLECVQFLHESQPPIIHRDIKPANILITETSKAGRYLKIGDFGIAILDDNKKSSLTTGKGTLQYMAPEVLNGPNHNHNIKADIYSLSFIASELFDFDINSSENGIINNSDLSSKWEALSTEMEKMGNITYNKRPTCAELLDTYQLWGINSSQLFKNPNQYHEIVEKMKNFPNHFFYDYFNDKLFN